MSTFSLTTRLAQEPFLASNVSDSALLMIELGR